MQAAIRQLLRWASRADVRRVLAGEAGQDLSPTETWLLGQLVDNGPMRVTDLARWQGVDKSTMTPQVRRLEDHGFITRRSDPADRRAALLSVTAQGDRLLRQIHATGAAVFDDVLRDWAAPDGAALAALLTRFVEQLTPPEA